MSASVGKDGRIFVASSTGGTKSLIGFIDSFTVNRSVGSEDQTEYGDSWGSHLLTVRDWTADVSGTVDSTNANQLLIRDQLENGSLGRTMDFLFMLSTSTAGEVWSGTGHILSDSIGSEVRGKVSYRFNVQGEGELSWSPAT